MGYVQSTADLEAYLTALRAARTAVLLGKSYSINGFNKTMADEKWISQEITRTESKLAQRTSGSSTTPIFINSRS